jgi:hypothetical protein
MPLASGGVGRPPPVASRAAVLVGDLVGRRRLRGRLLRRLGRICQDVGAVQVDPIKPKLKPPGT